MRYLPPMTAPTGRSAGTSVVQALGDMTHLSEFSLSRGPEKRARESRRGQHSPLQDTDRPARAPSTHTLEHRIWLENSPVIPKRVATPAHRV